VAEVAGSSALVLVERLSAGRGGRQFGASAGRPAYCWSGGGAVPQAD